MQYYQGLQESLSWPYMGTVNNSNKIMVYSDYVVDHKVETVNNSNIA